ncbi:hypothetical protein [Bifidobacterium cuniculi]|uniref:Uncharacterized protein n=1 Tax=Bifidobacterium cuniculi TaxID=1688 RepID=A0A087ATD2_9BIFI|nr:hypothetical protein [Bifidobacterium cuniculi]KFI62032.1 hypothetical protein BCUN_1347 [Bifidobacterium cuniculi]
MTTKNSSKAHSQLEVVSAPYDSGDGAPAPAGTAMTVTADPQAAQLQSMQLDHLKEELAGLRQEQALQGKRMDDVRRQIKELEKMQEAAGIPPHSRAWNITDTALSWTLIGCAAGTLIPIFLVLFGIIGANEQPIRWVSFGLAGLAVAGAVFSWMFARKLPKSKAASIVMLGAVLMLGFAWLI